MITPEYHFRILRVNLTTQETSIEAVPLNVLEKFIGGATLGAWLLYPHLTEELDPLSPEAPLLFITGPLTGTLGPAVGRFVICAKSPATGLWGESNVGGHFGAELRSAGYDGLFLTGVADSPTYLSVTEGGIAFHEAGHLWGREDAYSTQKVIKEELCLPGTKVACIGLAGENLVPFSVVLCDHGRVAGRTGMGAVMGSKNLKAVAVQGTKPIRVIDEERFSRLRRRANIDLKEDNGSQALRQVGTSGAAEFFDYVGAMPKSYFTKGSWDAVERISGAEMEDTILSGVSTCNGCVVACGRVVKLRDEKDQKGPEYETIAGFGPNLGISDLSEITRLGALCDTYGMDTISLSNVIGLVTLLYKDGVIDDHDTGGLQLDWGQPSTAEEIIHLTARCEGIGEITSKGAKWIGDHFGVPEKAAQVNGLELAYHDPRGLSGMGVVYATSPRGACHNQSDYYMVDAWSWTVEDLGIIRFSRKAGAEKSMNIALHQDWRTISNSLVVCILPSPPVAILLDCLAAVSGMNFTNESIMKAGERGWNLKRLINLKLGLTRMSEVLPEIVMKPLDDGAAAGYLLPFEEMMVAYYQARSWDLESGHPNPEKLVELDLVDLGDR